MRSKRLVGVFAQTLQVGVTADGDPEQDYERGGENALPEGEMWREEDDARVTSFPFSGGNLVCSTHCA